MTRIRRSWQMTKAVIGVLIAAVVLGPYVRAQIPTQTTGHLVSAAEWNQIVNAVNAINSVPSGTIAYFNNTSCPTGWGAFVNARGLYIVGTVDGGTPNAQIGSALADQENRTHTHSLPGLTVPGLSIPGLAQGEHVHGGTAHTHTFTTDSGGAHTHTYSGTTSAPSATSGTPALGPGSGVNDTHVHAYSGTTDSGGAHTHTGTTAAGGAIDSQGCASHGGCGTTGTGTTGGSTTGTGTSGTQSATIAPYLQLLVCQKS